MPLTVITAIVTVSFVNTFGTSPTPDATFELDALCAEAAALLRRTGALATDARIRELPDARTVRFYQSLGLLDRPLRYEGRRALYGWRHVLQMVCVKLLQAQGLSLAQAQTALAQATTAQLEAAVREALGGPVAPEPPAPVAPAAPITPVADTFSTFEIAPGLLVTVDRRRFPSPESLVARLAAVAVASFSSNTPFGG